MEAKNEIKTYFSSEFWLFQDNLGLFRYIDARKTKLSFAIAASQNKNNLSLGKNVEEV